MDTVKASSLFHGKEGYNCCQAVLKYAQLNGYDVNDKNIIEAKQFGGGRVEDNMCGALYALKIIYTNNEAQFAELSKQFADKCGSIQCEKIKDLCKASCAECVSIAADLLG